MSAFGKHAGIAFREGDLACVSRGMTWRHCTDVGGGLCFPASREAERSSLLCATLSKTFLMQGAIYIPTCRPGDAAAQALDCDATRLMTVLGHLCSSETHLYAIIGKAVLMVTVTQACYTTLQRG